MSIPFKIIKLHDDRIIVESPFIETYDKMMILSMNGIEFKDRKVALPHIKSIHKVTEAVGIVGMIDLCFGRYLIVATKVDTVATLQQHKIFRIVRGECIPVGFSVSDGDVLTAMGDTDLAQHTIDTEYLKQITALLMQGSLYFSTSYNLTHSMQHNTLSLIDQTRHSPKPSATPTTSPTKSPKKAVAVSLLKTPAPLSHKQPQQPPQRQQPILPICDDRYWFNKHLVKHFSGYLVQFHPWDIRCILGFAASIDLPLSPPSKTNHTVPSTLLLVSRVSVGRLGTRYLKRGVDEHGNAANSVEMEQMCYENKKTFKSAVTSFVQLRGSVPVEWQQEIDLSYRPAITIADLTLDKHFQSTVKHFDDLLNQYPITPATSTSTTTLTSTAALPTTKSTTSTRSTTPTASTTPKSTASSIKQGAVICINLLDAGFEGPLQHSLEHAIDRYASPHLHHEHFSINKWCTKGNYKNMDILLARVAPRLVQSGMFVGSGKVGCPLFQVCRLQQGVLRVNCLDSLDRTNLTCSMFAKSMLSHQINALKPFDAYSKKTYAAVSIGLSSASVSPSAASSLSVTSQSACYLPLMSGEDAANLVAVKLALQPLLPRVVNVWADSGDQISLLYAGTRALKSDVTRTGSKTYIGTLNDGVNSLTRYYLNNFSDAQKQDLYDVLTGVVGTVELQTIVQRDVEEICQRVRGDVWMCGGVVGTLGGFLPKIVKDSVAPVVIAGFKLGEMRLIGQSVNGEAVPTSVSNSSNATVSTFASDESIVVSREAMISQPHTQPQTYLQTQSSLQRKSMFETMPGFLVSLVKSYAPGRIESAVEFVCAMVCCLNLLVLVRVCQIKGKVVVNMPTFLKTCVEIVD